MKRRILATALTLCLTLSLVPTAAFAAGDKTFDDVNGHWGQASVERWAGYGVLNGDNFGNFNPDKQMTRAEFATMLANMMGYTAKASSSFGDVASDAWYADAVLKLAAAGVMLGDNNGNANPNKPISRAEAAVMLCRAFNIQPSNSGLNFADSGDVADWAKGSMAALAEKGMMNGVGNNQLAPLANITRASVAKLVDNMVSEYVTESKEITGTVNGIVLVVGSAEVTVKDATLTENLIVAPKAEGAEVTLTGSTTASDVYVDAAASVKVDAQASAGEVQLSAPKAAAEVAGKADTVTTTADAAEATVTVAKDATVSKVEVAAPNTGVNVAGKVENVNVASTAAGTEVKTESGAAVSNVTTSANDVKVSGNGKVENVTANSGTADVTTPGTKVENKTDSADNVTANGKPVPPSTGGTTTPTTPGGSGGSGGGGGVTTTDVTAESGIIGVDPVDKAAEGTITDMPAVTAKVEKKSNSDILTIKLTTGTKGEGTVDAVPLHQNDNKTSGHWVGVAIPLPSSSEDASGDGDVSAQVERSGYHYYFGSTAYTSGNLTALTAEPIPEGNATAAAENTEYGVFWIDASAASPKTHIAIGTSATDANPTKYVVDLSGVKLSGTQENAIGTLHDREAYTTAYNALGITFSNSNGAGILTVDEAQLLPRVFDEAYIVAHQSGSMTTGDKVSNILAGVQFEIPSNATKLDVTITGYSNTPYHKTDNVPADTTQGFSGLAGLDVYVSEGENAKAYLIDYVPVWNGTTGETITYDNPLTYRMIWTCSGDNNTTTTLIQTYTLTVQNTSITGETDLKYVVNKGENGTADIRTDGGNKYICFQIATALNDDGTVADNGLFPIQTNQIKAAAKVNDDKIIPCKLWTTDSTKPTDYSHLLELPKADLTSGSSDYTHHVGLTLKMDNNAADNVVWYFWKENGNSLILYKVTIPADQLKESTHNPTDQSYDTNT